MWAAFVGITACSHSDAVSVCVSVCVCASVCVHLDLACGDTATVEVCWASNVGRPP